MDVITLEAQPREPGKAATKAVRRDGDVPCVLYGHHTEPVHFRVETLALRPLIYTTETHRVSVQLDGASYDCVVKDIDFHPLTDLPIHVDFYALTAGEALTLTVPIQLVGTAPGVKEGGSLMQPLTDLEIRCLPANIPGHVEIDISGLGMGESLHVSDITVENAEIITDPSRTVVAVTAPSVLAAEDETEGLLLEGEEIAGEGVGTEPAEGAEPEADEA